MGIQIVFCTSYFKAFSFNDCETNYSNLLDYDEPIYNKYIVTISQDDITDLSPQHLSSPVEAYKAQGVIINKRLNNLRYLLNKRINNFHSHDSELLDVFNRLENLLSIDDIGTKIATALATEREQTFPKSIDLERIQ